LAPAVLGAAPAILWFWDRFHSWKVDVAVLVMAVSAFVFAWTPGAQIGLVVFVLAALATVFVAVRMRFAVRWVGQYDANTALVIAYAGQALFGLIYCFVTKDWQFVLGLIVLMVVVSSIGHRMLYASARHCTPTIAAALNPLSVVITAVGVVLVGGAAPSAAQIAVGCVWLLAGVFVSLTATNSVEKQKT
jgi:drug/metabolite transporter (DMT)-like permease